MFAYELKVAWHHTRRNPVLTALMVLAMAVGIGACMTTLAVVHLLSGDPLPGRSAQIYYPQVDASPKPPGREPLDMMDDRTAIDLWRAKQADQQALMAESPIKVRASDAALPPLMRSMLSTTADFFPMFEVPFLYGQGWRADDDATRARVVVISDRLNQRLFGGRDSVGQLLRLGDAPMRIVGVLAPWRPSPVFYSVRGGRFASGDTASFYGQVNDVFVPFGTSLDINAGHFQQFTCWAMPERPGHLEGAPCAWVALWVRLDRADKVAAYAQFLQRYAAEQKAAGRLHNADNTRLRSLMQWLAYNRVVPSDAKLQAVMAVAFLVICLANVVGLLLTKFLRHGGEIGLRRALGATRGAIFVQCLAESALIGLLGGAGGLLLTLAGLYLVRQQPLPYADLARLDVGVFLATFALALAASLLAGLLPALRASRIQPVAQLKLL